MTTIAINAFSVVLSIECYYCDYEESEFLGFEDFSGDVRCRDDPTAVTGRETCSGMCGVSIQFMSDCERNCDCDCDCDCHCDCDCDCD